MGTNTSLVDESHWPLVRVTVPPDFDDRTVDTYLARVDDLLARRQPFVMVLDARASRGMGAASRDRLRQGRRRAFVELQRYQQGMAFVVESALQRAILGAILWLAPEPCPSKIFSGPAEAEAWARSCLAKDRAA